MRTARHLWRRGLAHLQPFDRLASSRDDALLASAGEFEANHRALRDLLASDGRDTGDVPGFNDLADRQAELVELIVATPARSLAGVVVKARCARLRPPEQGFDAALSLALSASDDLLRFADAQPSRSLPSPTGPSHGTVVKTAGRSGGPQVAEPPEGVRRPAVLRLADLWRHLVDTLIQVGVWSLAGATVLPLAGVHPQWAVAAAVLGVGGSATFLVSCLRHTDRPA